MPQGSLSYQNQILTKRNGSTLYGGLPLYLDLIYTSGLLNIIESRLHARTGQQGWTDAQIIFSLLLLNFIGGKSVSDIKLLENDKGLCKLISYLECHDLKDTSGFKQPTRWRKPKTRYFPSASAIFDFLNRFDDPKQQLIRQEKTAFIPKSKKILGALNTINKYIIEFAQKNNPQTIATLDQDATLTETHKRNALFCYKKYKAYQPLNTYWFEQGLLIHSEFRDGNVPAGFEELRVFKEALKQLPSNVNKAYLRTDSAGYQEDLMRYCAEGKDPRFGVIEFAISAKVTKELKQAVALLDDKAWQPLYDFDNNGEPILTQQEWAEVCFVPNWIGVKKSNPEYRYIAIREYLSHTNKNIEDLPFPVLEKQNQHYKLHVIVTNRLKSPGDYVIEWHRQRCGKSEEVHKTQKIDLMGGRLPSELFGANAAWWQIMILAFNLEAIMQRIVLKDKWKNSHLKALRTYFIYKPAYVIFHGRQVIIRWGRECGALVNWLFIMRMRIMKLERAPPTQ